MTKLYERYTKMLEFDVNKLLTSFRRFENVCNYKFVIGDEEPFMEATTKIPFHIIE